MKILIVNAGSSSLKYQLVDMDGEKLMAKGLVEAQGQTLAFFQDPGTYDQAVAQAEDRASQILEAPVSLNQDLTLTTALAPKDQIESLSGVTSSILESIPQLTTFTP